LQHEPFGSYADEQWQCIAEFPSNQPIAPSRNKAQAGNGTSPSLLHGSAAADLAELHADA